jgi:hypothetical protein
LFNNKLKLKGIEWKLITPRSPGHGEFYERLLCSVKRVLRKLLKKASLTFTELQTVLTDAEAQVNSRTLSDILADKENPLPLTPGHLIVGRNLQLLPSVNKPEIPLEGDGHTSRGFANNLEEMDCPEIPLEGDGHTSRGFANNLEEMDC